MFLKVDNVGSERMSSVRLFQATGPATQNARLPSCSLVPGTTKSPRAAKRRAERLGVKIHRSGGELDGAAFSLCAKWFELRPAARDNTLFFWSIDRKLRPPDNSLVSRSGKLSRKQFRVYSLGYLHDLCAVATSASTLVMHETETIRFSRHTTLNLNNSQNRRI